MPNATTDGTHGKSTTKVIEDYPRAVHVVTVKACYEKKKRNTRVRTRDPWYDLHVPWAEMSGF